ncbi:MAG: GNAT family N-acetyltransferase [Actinomycetota bacterium]
MAELHYREETPKPEEFLAMRARAGMGTRSLEAAQVGLPHTLYAVCVRDGERLVAMGRIVGDGGLNYEIVDMAVDPDYQRQGIGYRIMEMLVGHLRATAVPSAYVSLIADDHAPALYAKFGFEPTAPASIGMSLTL